MDFFVPGFLLLSSVMYLVIYFLNILILPHINDLFSRPSDCLPSQLSLYELIGMMVDVGRGAAYLEVKKRVHRDLAARNCLISSRNSNTRITKIGNNSLFSPV